MTDEKRKERLEVLERLERAKKAAEAEFMEWEKEYMREKFGVYLKIICDRLLEKSDALKRFDAMKSADKREIAEGYADIFPVFIDSEDVKMLVKENQEKRDKEAEKRRARKAKKDAEHASVPIPEPAQTYQQAYYDPEPVVKSNPQ